MNKKLIIKTEQGNWDNSDIIAQGIERDGYVLNSAVTTVRAGDLPEPYLSVWHGLVETFRGQGLQDGERLCVMAEAQLHVEMEPDIDTRIPVERSCVLVTTTWQWPDGRMLPDEILHVDDAGAVGLVSYLLTDGAYSGGSTPDGDES